MMYLIRIEGQDIPVDETIAMSDDNIRACLAPLYPDAANALITRAKQGEDTTIVNVAKRAGTKGQSTPLDHLVACAGGMNPAVALHQEIQRMDSLLDIEAALLLNERIEQAIKDGEEQASAVQFAAQRLMSSRPAHAPAIILGF